MIPLKRMFTLRAESTFPSNRVNLTGFAALGQFLARDYTGVAVR